MRNKIVWLATLSVLILLVAPMSAAAQSTNSIAARPSNNSGGWQQQFSGTINSLSAVAYGGGRFVAVGDNGEILTSTHGTVWIPQVSGTMYGLSSVTYGGGRYVAVGQCGTILASSDGVHWSSCNSGTSNTIMGVTYGNGRFIAVDSKGTILSSPDGITWAISRCNYISPDDTIFPLKAGFGTFDGVYFLNGQYMLLDMTGDILASNNGLTWSMEPSTTFNQLTGAAYGNGLYVVVGDYGTVLTSSDGVNWVNEQTFNKSSLTAIAYGDGWFVAVGHGAVPSSGQGGAPLQLSGDAILSSKVATTWGVAELGRYSGLTSVAFGDSKFVAVGGNGTILTWLPIPSIITCGVVVTIGSDTVHSLWGADVGELPVPPVIRNNRTFVPLDFVAAQLGATVRWVPSSRQVIINLPFADITIVMTEGRKTYLVNGQIEEMDVAPFIANPGYTMIPLRFVVQALGDQVQWDQVSNSVIIGTPCG